MKLSNKLILGFGSILVLLLVIAGTSLWALNNSSNGFTQYRGLARDTNLGGRLQANMLMVRMNVKDFIITGSEKDLKQYAEYYAKMQEFMATAQNEIQHPERARLVGKAAAEVDEYGSYFKQLRGFRVERDALVNEVLPPIGQVLHVGFNDGAVDDGVKLGDAGSRVQLLQGGLKLSQSVSNAESEQKGRERAALVDTGHIPN